MERLFILGAPDPEMAAIEQLLTDNGERYLYAKNRGVRVHPGNCYRASWIATAHTMVCVECAVISCDKVIVVDHHRPGDPGYSRPPAEYLEASSIGQVAALLGIELTAEHRLVAAADHCLEAAYRGRCPGIDPDALMRWRIESRAAFQKRPVESVMADVQTARELLRNYGTRYCPSCSTFIEDESCANCPICRGSGRILGEYADMRDIHVPELPEAAAREGIPFLATVTDRDGREKVVLQAAGPDLVSRFLAGEIVFGLVDTYGDPARGFAGGYLT